MRSLLEIQQTIEKLARQINPPVSAMPTYDNIKNDGTPNIEVGNSVYCYRALDRDSVSMNRQTTDLNMLLYWIFKDITFSMSSEYELRQQDHQIDSRKVIFQNQLILLEKINSHWKDLREKEIAEILTNSPYKK